MVSSSIVCIQHNSYHKPPFYFPFPPTLGSGVNFINFVLIAFHVLYCFLLVFVRLFRS